MGGKRVRVLIADGCDESLIKALERCGVEVDYRPGIEYERLLDEICGYDAIVVRSRVRVDSRLIERGFRCGLRVIARLGSGVDNIDVETANRLGVKVVNSPEGPVESVAELTIGLMIAVARRIVELNTALREGRWVKGMGVELMGKTLFIIGLGRIGSRVAELAKAFGMRVLAYDVADVRAKARALGVDLVDSLCDGLKAADFITIHVPLTRDTLGMVNYELLARCAKRGAVLINTSRGAVVDTEGLLRALDDGIIGGAGLDVLEEEPPRSERVWRLVRHPRVIVTPHIGAQTREALRRSSSILASRLLEALNVGCGAY